MASDLERQSCGCSHTSGIYNRSIKPIMTLSSHLLLLYIYFFFHLFFMDFLFHHHHCYQLLLRSSGVVRCRDIADCRGQRPKSMEPPLNRHWTGIIGSRKSVKATLVGESDLVRNDRKRGQMQVDRLDFRSTPVCFHTTYLLPPPPPPPPLPPAGMGLTPLHWPRRFPLPV